MKVLFIQPPKKDAYICTPPLGIGYLMGFLKKKGIDCSFIDALKEKLEIGEIVERCRKEKPDIIGISIMTIFYENSKRLIEELSSDGTPIVVGGSHVSSLPVETLKDTKADYAVYGEGEFTLLELIKSMKGSKKKILGLAYREGKKIRKNPPRPLIEDLDSLPFPDWEKMDPSTYSTAPHGTLVKNFPVASVLSSRGCPYNCDYCSVNAIWRQRYRPRSAKNIVDEVELLIKKYGVREIHFEDDNLTLNRKRVMELCGEIKGRKLKFSWACPNGVRIDTLDEELLKKMKDAGCYSLSFGIESGSQKVLDDIHKRLDLKIVPEVVRTARRVGIETKGFFIMGFPTDTEETINETIEFAKSLDLDVAGFFICMPLPGSNLFDDWVKKKKLKIGEIDWDEINKCDASTSVGLSALPPEKIYGLYKRANREFFFRPKIILHLLFSLKPKHLKWLVRRKLFAEKH